jgi:hypothetical protein
MRVLSLPWWILCVPALCVAAGAQEFHVYNASSSAANTAESAVACGPDGAALVAWVDEPGEIWTRLLSGEWEAPVLAGNGEAPSLCYSAGQFVLAYADGASLVLLRGDGHGWAATQTIQGGGTTVVHPDLSAAPAGATAQAYATWQEENTQVWFSQLVGGAWSPGQLVVTSDPVVGEAMPQVAPAYSGTTVVPRVYYYEGLSEIRYRQRVGGVWGDAIEVPGRNYGISMSVAAAPSLLHHILSNGPQPTCPCNHLNYVEELPGGEWALVERLDVPIDEYNWPMYPSIVVDFEETPRIFWFQQMHDEALQPSGQMMFYKVREEGVWIDHSDCLGGCVGRWNGLTVDPQSRPVFVWCEEASRSHDAMLCRYITSAAVPERGLEPGLRLAAGPRPARGDLTFAIQLAAPAPARLEVFDAVGRCVERLFLGSLAAGSHRIAWDARGAGLGPGVYRARVTGGGGEATTKIVLVD